MDGLQSLPLFNCLCACYMVAKKSESTNTSLRETVGFRAIESSLFCLTELSLPSIDDELYLCCEDNENEWLAGPSKNLGLNLSNSEVDCSVDTFSPLNAKKDIRENDFILKDRLRARKHSIRK